MRRASDDARTRYKHASGDASDSVDAKAVAVDAVPTGDKGVKWVEKAERTPINSQPYFRGYIFPKSELSP